MFCGPKNTSECHEKVVSYELYFLVFDMCHFENRELTSALSEINNHPVDFRNCKTSPSLVSGRYVVEPHCKESTS